MTKHKLDALFFPIALLTTLRPIHKKYLGNSNKVSTATLLMVPYPGTFLFNSLYSAKLPAYQTWERGERGDVKLDVTHTKK